MIYSNSRKEEILYEIESKLIPTESLSSISHKFKQEIEERLTQSDNSMLPSFLKKSTLQSYNSRKSDSILAIDFGGTNLKFAIFKTYPSYSIQYMNSMTVQNKLVDLKFFNNIVETIILEINDYFMTQRITSKDISISITFSFPLNSNNEITAMGKDFILTDEIKGKSIDKVLQSAFNKFAMIHLNGKFNFWVNENIINDSIAVHLTNKYIRDETNDVKNKNKNKKISLILGTGLNTCFEVPFAKLPNFKKQYTTNSDNQNNDEVIINSELGFLGTDIIKLCEEFDVVSTLKMPMPLENITSGNYLPEILKRILNYYHIYPELTINFDGEMFCQLIEGEDIKSMLSDVDIGFIREIALIVLERASIYIVGAIEAIHMFVNDNENNNNKLNENKRINIGYVGSFLAYGKTYQEMIGKHSKGKINLQFLPDSSLIGAAVIAEKY